MLKAALTPPSPPRWLTHGSWSLLWPVTLLILRVQKWRTPWPAFWRRHIYLIRTTAQMVESQSLHLTTRESQKSPTMYILRKTAFITCALTVAGGSWYVAVDLTSASDLTAIYNCSAFFAYAFSIPLLKDKLRFDKMFSVAVAIAGVLIVAYGDSAPTKHGGKSGGSVGGGPKPDPGEENNVKYRTVGNIVIGVGSVLYGLYEVLYKKLACPPEGTSPGRGMIFAMTMGSLIGSFTLFVLWIPLPILHITGIELFELPQGKAAWMLAISVLANASKLSPSSTQRKNSTTTLNLVQLDGTLDMVELSASRWRYSVFGMLIIDSILGLLSRSDLTHLPSPLFRRCSVSSLFLFPQVPLNIHIPVLAKKNHHYSFPSAKPTP